MNFSRFIRNLLLAFIPVVAIWLAVTPTYNRFLTRATENLVKLSESPNHTTLRPHDKHFFLIYRDDVKGRTSTGHVFSVRVTDVHFPVLLMAAMFLAVPGVSMRQRFGNLGWALLASVFFHVLSTFFWVKFAYATQLGTWSLENYGAFARNFWGLGKHILDLAFKFAWPLAVWLAFYGRLVLGSIEAPAEA